MGANNLHGGARMVSATIILAWLSQNIPVSATEGLHNRLASDPWWRHQMEPFSALLALCAGNSQGPVNSPHKGPVTRSFDVFFDLRLNKRLSKQPWGWWFKTPSWSLWRQCNAIGQHSSLQCNDYKDPTVGRIHELIPGYIYMLNVDVLFKISVCDSCAVFKFTITHCSRKMSLAQQRLQT